MAVHGNGGDATGRARMDGAPVDGDLADDGSGPSIPEARSRTRSVPEAAVGRLAVCLRVLSSFIERDVETVSSEELASAVGVNPAKLRKDLSYLGSPGTRGVGYDTASLSAHIERLLGLNRQHSVAVVGIGNLGQALANYGGFPGRGFPVAALFDVDEDLLGRYVGGVAVRPVDQIPATCARLGITIGVIATPVAAAQQACDLLVDGNVRCVLNFAPVVLSVPEGVEVRKVDLAVEMQILSFHDARRADGLPPLDAADDGFGGVGVPGHLGGVVMDR